MGGSQSSPKPASPPPRRPSPPPRRPSPPLFRPSPPSNVGAYTSRTSTAPFLRPSPLPVPVSPPSNVGAYTSRTSTASASSGASLLPAADVVNVGTTKVRTTGAAVASPATVGITHDILDYIVEKVDPSQCMIPSIDFVPRNARCDRHILRVCQIYQQRRYVCQKFCHRFHVCLSWINGQCNSSSCSLDHGFHSAHNQQLTRHLVDQRSSEDQLIEQLKKNVEFGRKARSKYETVVICPHNVVGRCKHQNCRNLHLRDRYSWQVQDGNWVRFPKPLTEFLENSICDPEKEVISLELKVTSDSHTSDLQHLQKIFGRNSTTADVNFRNMTLCSQDGRIYPIRRLSTPSDIFANNGQNTRWLWYLKSSNGQPRFLTHGETEKFYQLALSDCLERALQNGESEVKSQNGSVVYDLVNFTFKQGYTVDQLMRRPAKLVAADAKDEKPIHFRDLWSDSMSNGIFSVADLSVGSNEYMFVESMFRVTQPHICIQKIFRIQNRFLWDAYQLKKRQMLQLHKGDVKLLKEQYMFHGTKASVLDQIYEGNLDWRLYGSNVGCVFGRGTYFSNQASVSDGYTSGSPKVILVAMVLVGDACKGDRSMDYPPKNPQTNLHFDTTVNAQSQPTIYVKYNDDEYYPAYAVYYN